jgi:hypothetical protein
MDPHYAIRGVIRYYGWLPKTLVRHGQTFVGSLDLTRNADVSLWTVAPHVRLANLPTYDKSASNMRPGGDLKIDAASVESFLKRYGPLYREDYRLVPTSKIQMPDKSQGGPRWIKTQEAKPGNQFKESLGQFLGAQQLMRHAWSGDQETITEHFRDGTLAEAFKLVSFEILQNYADRRPGEVLLETEDLWEYMRYLFLVDYAEQRTGVCEREDCPTPYFVRQRKGQRYCSHECAVLENVRRFRSKTKEK